MIISNNNSYRVLLFKWINNYKITGLSIIKVNDLSAIIDYSIIQMWGKTWLVFPLLFDVIIHCGRVLFPFKWIEPNFSWLDWFHSNWKLASNSTYRQWIVGDLSSDWNIISDGLFSTLARFRNNYLICIAFPTGWHWLTFRYLFYVKISQLSIIYYPITAPLNLSIFAVQVITSSRNIASLWPIIHFIILAK